VISDREACYRALAARDRRFDGTFFVGVGTTGIYCRPVCPARLPAFDRCRFFRDAAAAEAEGYRPCLRCRPERAPGRAIVDATQNLAARAATRIASGALNGSNVERLAAELHVGSRQLRRAMRREYGTTPVQIAQTHRLLLAKRLLTDTKLPVGNVALASGFSSLRRFNALFRQRYRMAPSDLRRGGRSRGTAGGAAFALRLEYRPPMDWARLVGFLAGRTISGVETVEGPRYRRTVSIRGHHGWIGAQPAGNGDHAIELEVAASLLPVVMPLLSAVRSLLDLDAEPQLIAEHLRRDAVLRWRLDRSPGLRVPGALDGFELAWRAVLGQQVSVEGARTLAGRLVEAFAEEADALPPGLSRRPVRPERLAGSSPDEIMGIGLTRARAECVHLLACRMASGELRLEPGSDAQSTVEGLCALPGIGPWTAQYIALRALHWPDAFPESDLGIRRALGDRPIREIRSMAEKWRPWRAYAALHLWSAPAPAEPLTGESDPRSSRHRAGRPDGLVGSTTASKPRSDRRPT
jgi:AraC family transcriptional regulator, regulatory protein of adaptative response / DNA-3-methyladenine glycosylase II